MKKLLPFLIVCVGLAPALAHAQPLNHTLTTLTHEAHYIVEGTVLHTDVTWATDARGYTTPTRTVTLRPERLHKGALGDGLVTLTLAGEPTRTPDPANPDVVPFAPGEAVVVFLTQQQQLLGHTAGKVSLRGDRALLDGRAMPQRDFYSRLTDALNEPPNTPSGQPLMRLSVENGQARIDPLPQQGTTTARAEDRSIEKPMAEPAQAAPFSRKMPKGQLLPARQRATEVMIAPDDRVRYRPPHTLDQKDTTQVARSTAALAQGWQNIKTEGFEGAFPNEWTISVNGADAYWDDTDVRAHSGNWSAWCADEGTASISGLYVSNMRSWLVYGPFDLSDASGAVLEFYYWNQSETDYDYFFWGASVDGSSYSGTQVDGDSNGWQQVTMDLTNAGTLGDLTGQTEVWIAFLFQSDASIVQEGAYIDDVILRKDVQAATGPDLWWSMLTLSSTTWQEGQQVTADLTVDNLGNADAGAHQTQLYLSTNDVISNTDLALGSALAFSGIAAGSDHTVTSTFTVPTVADGTYWIGALVDVNNDVVESNEGNNGGSRQGTVTCCSAPDLRWATLSLSATDWSVGQSITGDLTVENLGNAAAGAHQTQLYLSTNDIISTSDQPLGSPLAFGSIAAGSSQMVTSTFTVPSIADGTYWVGALVDINGDVAESNEGNNGGSRRGTVTCCTSSGTSVPIQPTVTATTQQAGAEFWVDIHVGSSAAPVTDLFGVSFTLSYNTTYLDVVTPHGSNVVAGSFLGSAAEMVFLQQVDEQAGTVSIGISRTGGAGISGQGQVARVRFRSATTTPDGMAIAFVLNDVVANAPSGASITLSPQTLSVTLQAGVTVWPGDTNQDGTVNQADVLPIGLCWGQQGSARPGGSMGWVGQNVPPWSMATCTYADANGDGTVNQADVLPIGLNWGRTHNSAQGIRPPVAEASKGRSATLRLALPETPVNPGDTFWVDVHVNDVSDLFGLAFDLRFAPTNHMEALEVQAAAWIGDDVIFFPTIDNSQGKVSVGVSRKAGQGGISGSGVVARVRMQMNAAMGVATDLNVENITANDPGGQAITVTGATLPVITDTESHDGEVPGDYVLAQNYPNPFNPTTMIRYSVPAATAVTLKVYDLLGQEVARLVDGVVPAGSHQVRFEAQGLSAGMYFYVLDTGAFRTTRQMVLLK